MMILLVKFLMGFLQYNDIVACIPFKWALELDVIFSYLADKMMIVFFILGNPLQILW